VQSVFPHSIGQLAQGVSFASESIVAGIGCMVRNRATMTRHTCDAE
jgi:hypothetical protein